VDFLGENRNSQLNHRGMKLPSWNLFYSVAFAAASLLSQTLHSNIDSRKAGKP